MENLDVNLGQTPETQEPGQGAAKSKGKEDKGAISPARVKELIENLTTAQPKTSLEAVKVTKKEGTVEQTDDLAQGVLQFAQVATEKGMSREEIDHHVQFIAKNIFGWMQENKEVPPVKVGAHTIEFIRETGTVVTHFEGTSLGKGAFAKVQESIVSASLAIPIGTCLARKVPEGKESNIVLEGAITQQFNDSQNVRGCHIVNKNGIMLELMAETLETKLKSSQPRSFDENLAIAKQLGNGHAKYTLRDIPITT